MNREGRVWQTTAMLLAIEIAGSERAEELLIKVRAQAEQLEPPSPPRVRVEYRTKEKV